MYDITITESSRDMNEDDFSLAIEYEPVLPGTFATLSRCERHWVRFRQTLFIE